MHDRACKNTVSWQRGSGVSLAPWLAALYSLILSQRDTPALSPDFAAWSKAASSPHLSVRRRGCRHHLPPALQEWRRGGRPRPPEVPVAPLLATDLWHPVGRVPLNSTRETPLGSKSILFRSPFSCSAASAVGQCWQPAQERVSAAGLW